MASTSASSLSVQKQCRNSDESLHASNTQRRKSCDTVCSSNSSCYLQKRKQVHPLAGALRAYGPSSSGGTVVRQRVLSARMLKLRSVQSQLNDANFHLSELAKENRALKTLQKRQDKALKNYEGVNADLPRLIQSHEEEIRVLRERNKTLRKSLKEAVEQLKIKEEELNHAREQLKHLTVLTKDKHLGEREKLSEQVEDLKEKLNKSETQISLLNRKLMLETKNGKFRLNAELIKNKQTEKELSQALAEIAKLAGLVELKEKLPTNRRKRFSNITKRQSISLISLGTSRPASDTTEFTETNSSKPQSSSSDVKLAPIVGKQEVFDAATDFFVHPSENIKARLSGKCIDLEETSTKLANLNLSETEIDLQQKSIYTVSNQNISKSRPNSSQKLEKISNKLQKSLKLGPNSDDSTNNLEQKLGDCCVEAMSAVKNCSKIVDRHKEHFEEAKSETEKLISTLKQTDEVDAKLRKNILVDIDLPVKDVDIINKIWNDEYRFQMVNNNKPPSNSTSNTLELLSRSTDKNGNIKTKETEVTMEDKRKLLATLRAIDNGESVEEVVVGNKSKKNHIMKELFGDLN